MKSPVAVLHVLGTGEQRATALARIVENLAGHIDASRYRSSVLFLRHDGPLGDRLRDRGIRVSASRWEGGWSDPAGAWRFSRELRREKAAIVHFHAGGLSPRLLAKSTGAWIVMHYHSLAEESGDGKGVRTARGADLVIANSAATALTVSGTKALVVHPGVRVPPRVASDRARDSRVTIGVAARLVPVKGIAYLLTALAAVRRESADVVLQIAGAGPAEAGLRDDAEAAGVADAVEFRGWRDDVTDLMRRWDIYVQPSLAEGFGMSVLEAMAVGLPVIATDVGGLPEIVEDGVTGWLVPPADSAALARRITALVRDPVARRRMGDAGRARAELHFSLDREAAAIQSAYDRLLS